MKLECQNCGETFRAPDGVEFCPDCIECGDVVTCEECGLLFQPMAGETLCEGCQPDEEDEEDEEDGDRMPGPTPERAAEAVATDFFRYEKLEPAEITPEFAANVAEQLAGTGMYLRVRDYSDPKREMVDLDPVRWKAAFVATLLRFAA